MQQIFFELEHRYTGYMILVEALLQQCVVKIVRNYEYKAQSKVHFSPSNLVDSKYIIVEESFLYEYETITMEHPGRAAWLKCASDRTVFKGLLWENISAEKNRSKDVYGKDLFK